MVRKTHHVVPNSTGGWSVKKGEASRASKAFERKQDATKYARVISKNQKSELIIHKEDGTIQRTDSYGKDPISPRDKDTHKKK